MRILLTNDDGFDAEGLEALYDALKDGHDVLVAAPEAQQSGTSHRISIEHPLRIRELRDKPGWSVLGSPAECVKLALTSLVEDPVDLVISGINRGTNQGVLAHYSGTVGAAKEAVLNGVPAIAVSLCQYRAPRFEAAAAWTSRIVEALGARIPKANTFLNINVPGGDAGDIKGVRFTRMSMRRLDDGYERRSDTRGRPYFWLSGKLAFDHAEVADDVSAVIDGYIAVTPMSLDWTNEGLLSEFSDLEL